MSNQDDDVTEPQMRLGVFLSLLRILAGRRGRASVKWFGAGFTYYVLVVREDAVPLVLDDDPTAEHRTEVRQRIIDAVA
jgi:hypothetical protein